MNKKELIRTLEELEARSMWEMLPAFTFKKGKNYTQGDLLRAYYKGIREMEEVWHRIITELKEEVKK